MQNRYLRSAFINREGLPNKTKLFRSLFLKVMACLTRKSPVYVLLIPLSGFALATQQVAEKDLNI